MVDDSIHHLMVGEERDDLHGAAAVRTKHRVNLIDLTDHLSPALGGDGPELLLDNEEGRKRQSRLLDLPSMGVGVEAIVRHGDLALVRDMGDDPGDELQIIHRLHLFGLLPILVANLPFPLIEGEPLQGQKRPDHVFSDPLGLGFCPGPDPAVD